MYTLIPTNQFKKDLKKIKKRSIRNQPLIADFLSILQQSGVSGIPKSKRPHKLSGNYEDNWEAHIKPDLLIIWFEIQEDQKIILIRIGSHSDLF